LAAQDGGVGAGGQHFVVVVYAGPETGPRLGPRLGVVASRKVGNAVARNRGKRCVREWFRHSRHRLGPVDVVVILRPGVAELSAAAVARELDATLLRALKKARRHAGG
jgi:ribonuclease P protein component